MRKEVVKPASGKQDTAEIRYREKRKKSPPEMNEPAGNVYEGENETYIEASVENSSSILYDKEIRNKPRTRRTKRNV